MPYNNWNSKIETAFSNTPKTICVGVISCVFSLLILYFYYLVLGLEYTFNDDLLTLSQVQGLTIKEIFTSTIIDSNYYRPIIQLAIKGSYEVFGVDVYPIRISQIVLHIATLVVFCQIGRTQGFDKVAVLLGGMVICFSPFTYFGIAKYAIEIGTYFVGFLFVLALLMIVTDKLGVLSASIIVVFALLTREQGLLIAFTSFLYFLLSRKVTGVIAMVFLVGMYLAFRVLLFGQIGSEGLVGSTGWFTEFLTVSQLEEKFGDTYVLLYLYNIVSHLVSLVFYLPVKGQFLLPDKNMSLFVCTHLMTSVVAIYGVVRCKLHVGSFARGISTLLLLLVGCNAIIAYSYCRHRMLFIAGIILGYLFTVGMNAIIMNEDSRRKVCAISMIACFLWGGVALLQLGKLSLKSSKLKQHYRVEAKSIPGVESEIYNKVRKQLMGY